MTQRNPMNERYTSESGAPKGKTRKSAASAKPVTKAGYSVRVQPSNSAQKSKTEKAKAAKERDKKDRAIEKKLARKYRDPENPEYKAWRTIWVAMLAIGAVALTVALLGMNKLPQEATTVALITGYLMIVGSLIVDITKVRKLRKDYQRKMSGDIAKDRNAMLREERYQEKHAQHIAKKKRLEAQEAAAGEEAAAEKQKSGLGGLAGMFGKK